MRELTFTQATYTIEEAPKALFILLAWAMVAAGEPEPQVATEQLFIVVNELYAQEVASWLSK